MRVNAVDSTMYALSGALRAAAGLAVLEQTCGIHAHAVVVGLDGNVCVGTALVDAYGKAGGVDDAARVFKGLGADRNLITWNTVLSAHAQQGDVQAVIGLFNQMMELGFAPDGLTFLAVLTACSNAGAATEAEFWLETMQSKYSVKPGLEHYTCVVGAMARMGRLEDAESVACTMPCKPDAAVWRTLLMGCVVHRKVDLAESMGQRLLEINPKDDSAYVLLANVYSAAGKKNEEAEAWTAMRDHGVRKEGGRSWIEVRGLVHVFVANERRHEQLLEIYDKLTELILEVEKLGYKETDEGFGHHSERLALAYGLISGAAPSGKVLRIVKNLRICAHCHEFFKYASMVIDRVIVVRDVNRPFIRIIEFYQDIRNFRVLERRLQPLPTEFWLDFADVVATTEGEEVTFMDWGNATVKEIKVECGVITELVGELNLEGSVKTTKLKITWLADIEELVPLSLVEFDYLISKKKALLLLCVGIASSQHQLVQGEFFFLLLADGFVMPSWFVVHELPMSAGALTLASVLLYPKKLGGGAVFSRWVPFGSSVRGFHLKRGR
ncbi:Pentatricopeptide repeat-containing protein [Zea mays]|uniref:Pentatricopeptide repeat-containing protein n=1 Tax=Zea mays TaxID=4577 RepID=A0A3L6GCH0_MAIZE|nr:Pentatricopeptide repeat-containing protein [Zea mays]